jgi:TPP-dependent pyruvate/acetoin dehydrogenase alpha subunit
LIGGNGGGDLEGLYGRMVLIRLFEDAVQRLFMQGEIQGTTHLYQGQEAVSVGVCAALQDGDAVAATYRGHGACLAMGTDPTALMAELLGRETGVCGGRAGTMNVIDLEHGVIGCFGIVGGSIAAATGAALASRLRRDGTVAVAFFGDGAVNQAYFYECLNFAKVFSLPVLFVNENNVYGEYTRSAEVTAGTAMARVEAMEIPGRTIDGNDLWTVREGVGSALEGVRAGDGPAFVEALTYRFVGHSRSDPGKYRPDGELDTWRKRDPLTVARRRLSTDYGVSDEQLDRLEADVEAELETIRDAAVEAPFPDPAELANATQFKG